MLALVRRLQTEMAESQADFVLNSKDHLQNVEFPLDLARLGRVHLSPVLRLELAHLAQVHLSPVLRLDLAHLARVRLSRVLRLDLAHLARVRLSPVLRLAQVHLSPALRLDYVGSPLVAAQSDHLALWHFALNHW
jgi:hypothetical protein